MPFETNDKKLKIGGQPASNPEPFRGARQFVENNDVAGLMTELDKVPTDTKKSYLNKLSLSDGDGGRIELDRNNTVTILENIRKRAEERTSWVTALRQSLTESSDTSVEA